MTISFNDNNRTGAFVATTDYDNIVSGGVFNSSSNTFATVTYTIPAINLGEPQLVSFDMGSTPGWLDIYLAQASGPDDLMASFLLPAGTASFYNYAGAGPSLSFLDPDSAFTDCDDFTGSNSAEARILVDDVAVDLTVAASGLCTSFSTSTYDSGTKTATLSYDVDGAAVNHTVDLTDTNGNIKAASVDQNVFTVKSLALGTDNKYFNDGFLSGSSTSQQLYFVVNEGSDGKALPKDTPWPIAGGVFDLSGANADLSTVVFDTSLAKYSALVHGLGEKTKDGSFTLFVPYHDGDKYVGVCAGATTIAGVTNKCNGIYYVKDGQTKTNKDTKSIPAGRSVKASVITVGTKKFWQVEGLTGTGAFSANIASDPDTGISASAASLPAVLAVTAVTIGAAIAARRATAKVRK
jgi:hypothetical protein